MMNHKNFKKKNMMWKWLLRHGRVSSNAQAGAFNCAVGSPRRLGMYMVLEFGRWQGRQPDRSVGCWGSSHICLPKTSISMPFNQWPIQTVFKSELCSWWVPQKTTSQTSAGSLQEHAAPPSAGSPMPIQNLLSPDPSKLKGCWPRSELRFLER